MQSLRDPAERLAIVARLLGLLFLGSCDLSGVDVLVTTTYSGGPIPTYTATRIRLDGELEKPIGIEDTVHFGVPDGTHTFHLLWVQPHCSAVPSGPTAFTIPDQEEPVVITFAITCYPVSAPLPTD